MQILINYMEEKLPFDRGKQNGVQTSTRHRATKLIDAVKYGGTITMEMN